MFKLTLDKIVKKRSLTCRISSCDTRNSGRRKWSTNVSGACFPAPDSFRSHCIHCGNVPFLAPRVFPPSRRFFFSDARVDVDSPRLFIRRELRQSARLASRACTTRCTHAATYPLARSISLLNFIFIFLIILYYFSFLYSIYIFCALSVLFFRRLAPKLYIGLHTLSIYLIYLFLSHPLSLSLLRFFPEESTLTLIIIYGGSRKNHKSIKFRIF